MSKGLARPCPPRRAAGLRRRHTGGQLRGYEPQRGLREVHQTSGGDFAASASRTFNLPLAKLYEAWTDQKLRRGWLPDAKIEISTAINQSVRAAWDVGESRVSVYFYGRGEGKTQIAVDHPKLTSAKESARMKSYWREAPDRLQKWLPVHLEKNGCAGSQVYSTGRLGNQSRSPVSTCRPAVQRSRFLQSSTACA